MKINNYALQQIEDIKKKCQEINPLVVVWCITYNHQPYIKDALEGFLMQKTDFPFVVIVHEDVSTDGTAKILKEYAEKYPNIILPIFEKQNQFTQKDNLDRIMIEACKASGAKYTALCEGDDYWIDQTKLQTQVEFLEDHLDYSFCFHSVNIIKEDGCKLNVNIFKHLEQRSYNINEIIKTWTIPTCSVLCRTDIIVLRPFNDNFQYSDNVWWSTLLRYGKGFCLTKKMGVYRRQAESWTAQARHSAYSKHIIHSEALFEEFPEIDRNIQKQKLLRYYSLAFLTGIQELKISTFKYFLIGIKKFNIEYIRAVNMFIVNYIKGKLN